MYKLPLIEIAEINNHIILSDNFQDLLIIKEIDTSASDSEFIIQDRTEPVRINALFMILILKGTVEISLDYIPYTLTENSFATIMPTHVFQVGSVSESFKAKILLIDKSFLEEINTAKRSPSMTNYMLLRKNPIIAFEPEETEHVNKSFLILQQKIRLRTHSFHKEVLQNAFVAFLLELANIMVGKKENIRPPVLSRKEELLNDFLQLLSTHAREQHIVTFYAEKLFITPQYLSLILKELTGKSANKWINEALIIEAKVLLKAPQATVQQVADMLNFSDQSTFGKFFKKHMGISPMEYRKS
ncbi:AraC family transcriptional activator of pobA [Parabacteroides sp. PF5-5]|uniref:helix-turn-helix domain-containing protein n=1 Tax=unclassified Parabacteroides TaxID=2649774 RepID=UPI002473F0CC|nr:MULTISPECIES: helix-turn-helix domain-containing protein [unclassified Parabacteroides]MDH6304799.1 AraC family transcriptional activator of pobA [Parabacteroides sp. PH5-39]MDH6315586.1 AraC family transcriptional activator of pobA [Parabacteroides sp. PF5-13]MDH6319247.1 AraC family transcriptional activator of pobA [Parabacteroides sp. PH5-13]MDH6322978.1 AraC family transcriptional activator of pobA [Parabacteroides sp. PH5-8]MDH6326779.1 AraC family transcriptional activator of pobA [P